MIREMWGSFPRLIEENINGLLDKAEPRPAKAFMLYKTCQNEGLWEKDFSAFSKCLEDFFAKPRTQREKADFDGNLKRPMSRHVYEEFRLDFRSGRVTEKDVSDLASWAHHLMKRGSQRDSVVISLDVMEETLDYITNPPPYEKAEQIEFDDFCRAWKKTVFEFFGAKHDAEFREILNELRRIDFELREQVTNPQFTTTFPSLFFSRIEIAWIEAVKEAAEAYEKIPSYPAPKGPQKQVLLDLDRVIRLYGLSYGTRLPELIRNREKVRKTILDRCARLLLQAAPDDEAA